MGLGELIELEAIIIGMSIAAGLLYLLVEVLRGSK